jgi:hypothetical protein
MIIILISQKTNNYNKKFKIIYLFNKHLPKVNKIKINRIIKKLKTKNKLIIIQIIHK